MRAEHLKRAARPPPTNDADDAELRERVSAMLAAIERDGAPRIAAYARELDGWEGEIVVPAARVARAAERVPGRVKQDLEVVCERVRFFAERQRESLRGFESEIAPGVMAGQRLVPIATAGCYVPGGRYPLVASALMSIATARVAGVEHIVVCSPPQGAAGVPAAVLYAMTLAGADTILTLGGVQAIGALGFGAFTERPADIIVGPGNRFVVEAKRQVFGRAGIDLLAGPSEILVIADESADAELVAIDLVGQTEHGADSPAWLVTTSRVLAREVIERVPGLIGALPGPAREIAAAAWRDYGEVVVTDTREEAAEISDGYAPEHVEVHARDLDWWLERLHNYGSLFLGAETTVAYGDKCSGPNHILPTRRAARYTGGLNVNTFIKIVTYQRISREANRNVGPAAARISRLEGMEAHARTAQARLERYFPGEEFDLGLGPGIAPPPAPSSDGKASA